MRPGVGEPSVTVVVLAYDRPGSLARCLDTLSAQRVDEPFEIVVADDGSGPAVARVVAAAQARDNRIRHVRHEHRGIPATRNLGVAAARGRFVALVADDYVLAPQYLAVALRYLQRRPEAAVVRFDILPLDHTFGARISHCYYAASISRRLATEGVSEADTTGGVATTTLEAAGAAVFRAEVLAAVGPWNESLLRAEDTEQSARLRAAGYQVHLLAAGTVLQAYRRVPTDTLRKCYLTGIYRARLGAAANTTAASGKVRALARALDRARRGGDSRRTVVGYLPWMLLFEAAAGVGYLRARIRRPGDRDVGALGAGVAPTRR